jgi:hypothetical protein
MSFRHYRRPWPESRGDEFYSWGQSVWYFEVDQAGYPIRQIEQYERGPVLKYDAAHPHDQYGKLADQPLEADDFAGFEISAEEFAAAWTGKPSTRD